MFALVSSVLVQGVGLGASLIVAQGVTLPIWLSISIHAVVAGALALFLKLPRAWVGMNFFLWPSAILYHLSGLPSAALLLVSIVIGLIYFPTFWTKVPFYPTSSIMYQQVLAQLPSKQGIKFLDIGSGYGSLLFYLAQKRPDATFDGVEIAPVPVLVSRIRQLLHRSAVATKWTNFWSLSLSEYDVVYAFLAPDPMPALWDKARAEMKSGSVLLVNSFPVPHKEDLKIEVQDERNCVLYLYKM